MSANRIGALTGIAFLVLAIAGFAIGGVPPDPSDDSVQEIVSFYQDNDTEIWISVGVQGVALALLVFFAGYLSRVLRAAAGPGHTLSFVVLAGATIMATGAALDATINVTLVEAVDDVDPAAVQALSALWSNDYIPSAVGMAVFLLASGLSVVRHGGLPVWLGWVAIVLGVVTFTPAGFAGFLGGGLWIGVTSILLALRAGDQPGPAAPPATAPSTPAV